MRNRKEEFGMTKILVIYLFAAAVAWPTHGQNSATVPAGIETLHQRDITATVARDAEALTALFDQDAVLLQPGTPPIVGKAALHEFMKQAVAKSPSIKIVKYEPDIRDVQVAGDLAYEWGYFDAVQKSPNQSEPQELRAKLLRVMKRQPDRSWKFMRVMWLSD
jgi:uncharacterized protein (TIGR02246 family)